VKRTIRAFVPDPDEEPEPPPEDPILGNAGGRAITFA